MYAGEEVVCQKLCGMWLVVANQCNPVVGFDVVGYDDVCVAVWVFV